MYEPGRTVRDLRLLRRLGRGGMAEVWLAQRSGPAGFSKRVVIKRLLERRAEEVETLGMLIDEARVAARLAHANVVQVSDLFLEEQTWCVVMEYIPGRSLSQITKRLRERQLKLSEEAAASIAIQLCEGLDYAHNARGDDGVGLGIVHRDIKPQNLLLTEAGLLKIIDFGVATARGSIVQTNPSLVRGTPAFMAPEQARCEDVDARADVYGVGGVMYRLLTGENPFAGLRAGQVLREIVQDHRPRDLAELRPDISPELAAIVRTAMEPNPEARYPSASALLDVLESWLDSRPQGGFDTRRLARIMRTLYPEGVDPAPPGSIALPEPETPPAAALYESLFPPSSIDEVGAEMDAIPLPTSLDEAELFAELDDADELEAEVLPEDASLPSGVVAASRPMPPRFATWSLVALALFVGAMLGMSVDQLWTLPAHDGVEIVTANLSEGFELP